MSLKYLEDWLLCMNGSLSIDGVAAKVPKWNEKGPIKLATYDQRFIGSVAPMINRGVGLTDRQVVLAVKVVTKYQRQWQQLGLDPSYLLTDDIPFRLTLREIDRTTSAMIEGNQIVLKFPYQSELINHLHAVQGRRCGQWEFHKENKSWLIDLTEGNVHLLSQLEVFRSMQWDIDPLLAKLMSDAHDGTVSGEHHPRLSLIDGRLTLRNVSPYAQASLTDLGWNEDADVLLWSLIAKNHGIELDPSLLSAFADRSLLQTFMMQTIISPRDSNKQNSMGRPLLREVMSHLPDICFYFYYRKHNLDIMMDAVNDLPNEKIFVIHEPSAAMSPDNNVDKRKTIVVFDSNVTTRYTNNDFLGVLYIIPDDGKIDA